MATSRYEMQRCVRDILGQRKSIKGKKKGFSEENSLDVVGKGLDELWTSSRDWAGDPEHNNKRKSLLIYLGTDLSC